MQNIYRKTNNCMKTAQELDEYVSTGIVEAYVLGILNSNEAREFERQVMAHPLLQQQLQSAEKLLKPLIGRKPGTEKKHYASDVKHFIIPDVSEHDIQLHAVNYTDTAIIHKNFRVVILILLIFTVLYLSATLFFFLIMSK